MVNSNKNNWDNCSTATLWAYQTTYKSTTHYTPFELNFWHSTLTRVGRTSNRIYRNCPIRLHTATCFGASHHQLAQPQGVVRYCTWWLNEAPNKKRLYISPKKQVPKTLQKGVHILWCPQEHKIKPWKVHTIWKGPYKIQLTLPNNTSLLVREEKFNNWSVLVNFHKLPKKFTMSNVGIA